MAKDALRLWTDEFYAAINPRVVVVGFQQSPPGHRFIPTRQVIQDFDLWYIASGCGAVKIDGRWTEFGAGDLVTLKPGQLYQEERADARDPHVQYWWHVLPFGDDPHGYSDALARRWPRKISVAHQPRLGPLFAELFEAYTTRPEGHPMWLKSLSIQILSQVFTALRHQGSATHLPRAYAKLMAARDFIVASSPRSISLDELAEHADLSASYLSALFRRYLGCSPVEYQIRLRLRLARKHLAEGLTVSEVAENVGFSSLHYFSRMFRRHEGQSPTEYARRCRRK
jgi:AraC-like DNA-binding protein